MGGRKRPGRERTPASPRDFQAPTGTFRVYCSQSRTCRTNERTNASERVSERSSGRAVESAAPIERVKQRTT